VFLHPHPPPSPSSWLNYLDNYPGRNVLCSLIISMCQIYFFPTPNYFVICTTFCIRTKTLCLHSRYQIHVKKSPRNTYELKTQINILKMLILLRTFTLTTPCWYFWKTEFYLTATRTWNEWQCVLRVYFSLTLSQLVAQLKIYVTREKQKDSEEERQRQKRWKRERQRVNAWQVGSKEDRKRKTVVGSRLIYLQS